VQILRIELVDEHELCRRGLRAFLDDTPGVECVAEAADMRTALELARTAKPDLAVIDLFLPGAGGAGLVREMRRQYPSCRVLVLTSHASEMHALEALEAGAFGYALKDQKGAEILEAIRVVGRGGMYLAPRFPRTLLDRAQKGRTRPRLRKGPVGELSTREREVFDLAVRAFTNDGIASELGISVKTVETHRARINRKLSVHSTGELVRFAALNGLLARKVE
jgi:DNA-binding NarL/FixJ family response regulator